jgi:LytS/YehU family sensor histidine kinase
MQGPPPPSAHFLNNVLAAAASYLEEDPDMARDVLAHLGQFLAYRLRTDLDPVPLTTEMAFVRTYLQLEDARFPDRIVLDLPDDAALPAVTVTPLSVQHPLQNALSDRLRHRPGGVRLAVRATDVRMRCDLSDFPTGDEPERMAIPFEVAA